jgi:hypothetical protein
MTENTGQEEKNTGCYFSKTKKRPAALHALRGRGELSFLRGGHGVVLGLGDNTVLQQVRKQSAKSGPAGLRNPES